MESLIKKSIGIIVLFLLISQHLFSQATSLNVFQEWAAGTGISNTIYKSNSASDPAGNIYVIGGTLNTFNGDYDWLITKYNPSGIELWSVSYDENNLDDYAVDITIDDSCNIYITGTVMIDTSQGYDAAVVKYDSAGTFRWSRTYDKGQSYPYYNDAGAHIHYRLGNIYICGASEDTVTKADFLVMKYDRGGAQQWVSNFDYGGEQDGAAQVYFVSSRMMVTGLVEKPNHIHGVVTNQYNSSTGALASTSALTFSNDSITEIHDIAATSNGDVYITGSIDHIGYDTDVKLIKMDSMLHILWGVDWFNTGDDEANAVKINEDSSYVYVAGSKTIGGFKDFLLCKLDTAGNIIYEQTFDGGLSLQDEAYAMALNSIGDPVITGYSFQNNSGLDYYTMKADQYTGNKVWDIFYNGLANKNDRATEIALDNNDNIYVIGQSQDSSGINSNFITVKYVEHELFNVPDDDTIPSNFDVTPNWGQLRSTDTLNPVNHSVVYYSGNSNIFFQRNILSHVFAKIDTTIHSPLDTLIRVDMVFSLDTTKKIFAVDKRPYFSSYYLPHTTATNGITNVPSYGKVVYPNLYKNIDVIATANFNGLKEQFIVKPGSSSYDIKFFYDGQDSIYLDNGKLIFTTAFDTIVYMRPQCSQIDSSGNYVSIGWQPTYKLNGDTVTFDSLQTYNINLPLMIEMNQGDDPLPPRSSNNPVWCTHYGDAGTQDYGYIDSDDLGNLYVSVRATNQTFPHQTEILITSGGGGSEACMMKFHPYGTPVWRILYGGDGPEIPRCAKYDNTNDVVYFGGWTSYFGPNETNFPTQPVSGSYNHNSPTLLGGTTYGYIVKFHGGGLSDGQRMWATLFGEDGDAFTEIISMDVNASGNLIIGGQTQNLGTFPTGSIISGTCGGTPYVTSMTGKNAGFVSVFELDNSLLWSTPFGSDNSAVLDVKFDQQNKIYIAGNVYTSDTASFPLQHEFPGDYSVGHSGGGYDAFISKFNFGCWELKWSTMFGGSGSDQGFSISPLMSTPNTLFIAGYTGSNSGFPIVDNTNVNSINQASIGGGTDGYVARFKNNILTWSTYVGGNGDDYIQDMEIGENNILYLTGGTESTNYVNLNYSGAYNQASLAQIQDAALIAIDIDDNHTNLWSTYFGGTSSDVYIGDAGRSITTSNDILYLCGVSFSNSTFPWNADLGTYPLAYYQPYRSGTYNDDLFLAQIDLLQTPIGIEEMHIDNGLIIYPNPASSYAYLKFDEGLLNNEILTIEIFDMQGRQVLSNKIPPISNGPIQINLLSLIDGMYVVRISTSIWAANKKFIVSR